jgi:hypothetical protein
MTNEEMIRPCTLPDYWKVNEPLDALRVTGINCGAYSDKIELETIWEGKSCKLGDPVLLFDNLPKVKELIDSDVWDEFLELDPEDQEKIRVKYFRETVGIIHNALNAPVLATEEVLAGLSKDAKIWVVESFSSEYGERITYDKATYGKWYDQEDYKYYGSSWVYKCFYNTVHHKQDDIHIEYPMRIQDGYKLRIIADKDDSKTAEYLRQFTLEGVRKETKDV